MSNINPEDIPDVPVNKFLMRGGASNDTKENRKRGMYVSTKSPEFSVQYLINMDFTTTDY